MRKLKLVSSVALALAVGAVWHTSSASEVTAPKKERVLERSSNCGVRPPYLTDFSASLTPEDVGTSTRGPLTLEQDGVQGAALGYCIDCTRCSNGKDCRHTGYTFCYAQCP